MKTEPTDATYPTYHNTGDVEGGLTKREYFAGLAMQGLLANGSAEVCDKTTVNGGWHHPETVGKLAVKMADALITSLNK